MRATFLARSDASLCCDISSGRSVRRVDQRPRRHGFGAQRWQFSGDEVSTTSMPPPLLLRLPRPGLPDERRVELSRPVERQQRVDALSD